MEEGKDLGESGKLGSVLEGFFLRDYLNEIGDIRWL